jgi:Flp pilus assembly protein TadD
MRVYPCLKIALSLAFLSCVVSRLFAQGTGETKELSALQKQARLYRDQGHVLQQRGEFDSALDFYRKAIELDPSYAVVYNDLGTIYDARGLIDLAEQSYLKAIKLDKNFLSPYSNLAFIYENKRDLEKAAFYWKKRIELGSPQDFWTQKAIARLEDLNQVVPNLKQKKLELETLRLAREASEQKRMQKIEVQAQANRRLEEARKYFYKNEYKKSIEELVAVLSVVPQDEQALELLDEAKSALRAQEKQDAVKKMQAYFQEGIRHYEKDDLHAATQEFKKIRELAVSPQNN